MDSSSNHMLSDWVKAGTDTKVILGKALVQIHDPNATYYA